MAEFNHTQSGGAAVWTINHNLNSLTVAVDVMIDISGNLEKVLPVSIEVGSANQTVISFSVNQTGKARLVTA